VHTGVGETLGDVHFLAIGRAGLRNGSLFAPRTASRGPFPPVRQGVLVRPISTVWARAGRTWPFGSFHDTLNSVSAAGFCRKECPCVSRTIPP
jgi:hypothetical protein